MKLTYSIPVSQLFGGAEIREATFMAQDSNSSILAPFRVLDLTDDKGFFCGRIMGDLGADVIKIEPPGGDPERNIPPFFLDLPGSERSLHWFALRSRRLVFSPSW